MFTALSAKNKVQFVDGTTIQPKMEDNTYDAWKRCNNMVVSWLVHFVSPYIRHNILWMDSAQAIWEDLKSRLFQGDLLRISELQNQAASLKQGNNTVTEFFTKLRVIWDELKRFRPEPTCSCAVRCSYKLVPIIAQRIHEDRVLQFLCGLRGPYGNIQSHVLLMDPMPPISKKFSYVVQ
ncbi:hypothetical protein V8G54_015091 [Vigna mungo]|uniref:Retrotransposon gag domain-containing protein n=1 Tax=Vigna mungo TaxID=3915 RepID=A0AAQ3RZV5_VIGMU